MRDILFRGKSVVNGEWKWMYGDLLHVNDMRRGRSFLEIWEPLPEGEFDPCNIKSGAVNPATVGQYTGVRDKYGVKIFEGDIVLANGGKPHEVMFADGGFFMDGAAISFNYAAQFAVIGNIHDNPELLEE